MFFSLITICYSFILYMYFEHLYTCAVKQTLINGFAFREYLIRNNMLVYKGRIAFSIHDV